MKQECIKSYFLVVLSSLFLLSCSRPDDTSTKLTFNMPPAQIAHRQAAAVNGQALTSTDLLQRVMINITGTGINIPIFQAWDSGGSSTNMLALPPSFNLVVPSGNARLVQVLSVYKNSVTQNMSFYYGDVTADLLSANMNLDVPIVLISTGAMVSGQVSGRYVDSSTGTPPLNVETGPTGIVEMSYTPPGRPSMIVDRNFIINGWLSFFMLSGVSLTYTVQPAGTVLWGGPVGLDSPMFASYSGTPTTPNPSQILRNYMPAHYVYYNGGGTPYGNEAEISVWGFWGAGLGGINTKRICTDLAGVGSYTNAFSMNPSVSSTLTALTTATGASAPTNAQLIDSTSTALSFAYYLGGETGTASSCAGATSNFKQYQFVAQAQLDGQGKDSGSGMNGILARQITGGVSGSPSYPASVTTSISASTNTLTLAGQVLPDVAGTIAESIRVFKMRGTQEIHSNVNCYDLAVGALGAVSSGATTVTASASGLSPFSVQTDITPTEANNGTNIAVCPVKAGMLLPMAALVNYHELGYDKYPSVLNTTIGASGALASFTGVSAVNTLATASASGCVTMNINLIGIGGTQKQSGMTNPRFPVAAATTTSASSSVMFYPNTSCTPTGSPTTFTTSFISTASMYSLSFAASGPGTYTITVTDDPLAPVQMTPVSFSFIK